MEAGGRKQKQWRNRHGSGTKYQRIAQENNIANPNLIYLGQVFKITTGGRPQQQKQWKRHRKGLNRSWLQPFWYRRTGMTLEKMYSWIAIHEEDLNANWQLLLEGQQFFKIPPLQ